MMPLHYVRFCLLTGQADTFALAGVFEQRHRRSVAVKSEFNERGKRDIFRLLGLVA